MTSTILRLLCLIPIALRLRSELALENLALRQQLAVLKSSAAAPETPEIRSIVLAFLVPILGALEGGAHHRQARHCRPMAPEAFRIVLEAALPQPSRSTWNRSGDPGADTEDGEI
jgi:hypothetical protein